MLVLFRDGTRWTGMSTLVPGSTAWHQEGEEPGPSVLGVVPAQLVLEYDYLAEGALGPCKVLSCYKAVPGSKQP